MIPDPPRQTIPADSASARRLELKKEGVITEKFGWLENYM